MHSTQALALSSLLMMGVGLLAWLWLNRHWPGIGRLPAVEPKAVSRIG
jgi:DHA1 family bicyclomycin/chloramphenicol resistance-like MFS transporter